MMIVELNEDELKEISYALWYVRVFRKAAYPLFKRINQELVHGQ